MILSKSKSKKRRLRLVREGHLNPEISRLDWSGLNPITRKTPTKKQKIEKISRKYVKGYAKGE